MGSVADKIARRLADEIRSADTDEMPSNVIDLAAFRASEEFMRETGLDGSRFKELIEKGRDSGFALYAFGQTLVSVFAEIISTMPEAKAYAKVAEDAEDTYMPMGPPISPLTTSYFTTWAFFDLQFGASRDTIGTCILRIAEEVGMPPWISDLVRAMQQTRMGFYVHCGMDGTLVKLKDILTQEVKQCHSASGYQGKPGQLWYTRLMPPFKGVADHHVVFGTPYIILDGTEQKFLDYIERELARMREAAKAKRARKSEIDAGHLLKYGPTPYHWHEYIVLAYTKDRHDAIFLTGVPDIPESMPLAHILRIDPEAMAQADKTTHIFRVSLETGLYRDLEIPSNRSLYDLAVAIVRAFDFDMDHLFGFYSKLTGNIYKSFPRYELSADMGRAEGAFGVHDTPIAQAFPKVGHKMLFLYDYGDEWRFRVRLMRLGEKVPRRRYPKILASVGEAPPQYGYPEEEDRMP